MQDHDCFRLINKVDIKLDKYSKERRCLIYKQLMMELSKYNQIQLLHQFTEEFMSNIVIIDTSCK